jgi:hypothetical protein
LRTAFIRKESSPQTLEIIHILESLDLEPFGWNNEPKDTDTPGFLHWPGCLLIMIRIDLPRKIERPVEETDVSKYVLFVYFSVCE